MGLLALKNQATDSVTGLARNLGLIGPGEDKHPHLTDYNIIDENYPNKNFNKSLGYGFKVVGGPGNWAEFVLQINPQSIQQDEQFSIQFFPTPTGITVEHQGSIMKDIVISGVTGNHPKRGAGGVDKDGDLIFGMGDSGYKQFHNLRNYIRAYVEHKKDPANRDMFLHFYNFKDQEFFIVEPTRFSLKRDKSRPLMYEYSIALKTIGRTSDTTVTDLNAFDRLLGGIDSVFESVANIIAVARGVINGALGLLMAIDKDIRSKILDPLNQISLAIQDFQNAKTKVLDMPRKFIKDLKAQIRDISDKLANKSGVNTSGYNTYAGKSSVFMPESGTVRTPTFEERKVLNTFKQLEQALEKLTFNNAHFMQTNEKVNSTELVQILEGETVQDVAARILGDATRFPEIVELNNLKYPYIEIPEEIPAEDLDEPPPEIPGSTATEQYVKKEGILTYNDQILIPRNVTVSNRIRGIYRNLEYSITKKKSEAERNLGVDLKINSNQDLAITNTGDIDLLAGVETVLQAIGTRLGVEKGSYKIHNDFGVNLNIGEKNIFKATLLKETVLQQLLADSRIEKGTRVTVYVKGNQVYVDVNAKIKIVGQTVPLQLVSVG